MGELYPRHEKRTKNPAETTGNRYKIEILMSRTQKLKELVAASLILKTLNDNPYVAINEICANKPHHLRRSEAMGGIGGQTNYKNLYNYSFVSNPSKYPLRMSCGKSWELANDCQVSIQFILSTSSNSFLTI